MRQDEVSDRPSFARYVAALIDELDDPVASLEWHSTDIRGLLDTIEAWALDTDKPANPNPWRHAADVLKAGRTYE